MTTLVEVGLSNVIASAALALVAIAVSLVCRRPAVVHALWLLVLLKLVTPPLFRVPLPWPGREAEAATATVTAPPVEPALPEAAAEPAGEEDMAGEPEDEEPAAAALPSDTPVSLPPAPPPAPGVAWQAALGAVWLGGAAAWFALALRRAWRFTRALRHARPAPAEVQRRVAELAAGLGLPAAPEVRLVPGRLPPMVWAVGRPVLLVPAELPDKVGPAGLDTLLVHELAHLRRRDHWVRWLELLVLGLFWWDPLAWYARQQLREAEEQCCDAWVVGTLPEARRAYASALVDALDFLSGADAPPVLASGVGQVADLKRRLTMILRDTPSPRLGLISGLAVFALTGLMPLTPGWASRADDDVRREVIVVGAGGAAGQPDLKKLEEELAKKAEELAALKRKIAEAARARAEDEVARAKKLAEERRTRALRLVVPGQGGAAGTTVRIEISGVSEAEAKAIAEAVQKALPAGKDKKLAITIDGKTATVKKPGAASGKTLRVVDPESKRVLVIDPATGKVLSTEPAGGARPGVPARPAEPAQPKRPGAPGETLMPGRGGMGLGGDRMSRIEKQLEAVMKELAELRKQVGRPDRGGAK